jgi:hypothetical protein
MIFQPAEGQAHGNQGLKYIITKESPLMTEDNGQHQNYTFTEIQ